MLNIFINNHIFHCFVAEHTVPGSERRLLLDTVDRDEVDDLDDPPTPVCYYIVAGNERGYFNIEPLSHLITVSCTVS